MAISFKIAVGMLVILQSVLLLVPAWTNSPTFDEPAHIVAGLYCVQERNFALYRVNPPLAKLVAGTMILPLNPQMDWRRLPKTGLRPEFPAGVDFGKQNQDQIFLIHFVARTGCILFSMIGLLVVCFWSRELYGEMPGLLAGGLYAMAPNVIAHGSLATPDAAGASACVLAMWLFWRWMKTGSTRDASFAGVGLGVAMVAKATCLTLVPLQLLIWLAFSVGQDWRRTVKSGSHMFGIVFIAFFIIHGTYGFQGAFRPLSSFEFHSKALGGENGGRNRFRGAFWEAVPSPLPKDYLVGIDLQKRDFERPTRFYANGQWHGGGSKGYYAYAFFVKTPVGLWALILISYWFRMKGRIVLKDEVCLLAPPIVIFLLVSWQTGINQHFRYALPAIPFIIIWASKCGEVFATPSKAGKIAVVGAFAYFAVSSLSVWPCSLAYFNELAGGPNAGYKRLLGSNFDWGQDLLRLKRWAAQNAEGERIYVALSRGLVDPSWASEQFEVMPPSISNGALQGVSISDAAPKHGWHAVSLSVLHDTEHEYHFFLNEFTPVAKVGYTINVYWISEEDEQRFKTKQFQDWLQ